MNWNKIRLEEIADFKNGVNYNKNNFGKGMKVINVGNFKDYFSPKYDELEEINPEGIINEGNLLIKDDILFVRSNGNKDLIGRSLFINRIEEKVSYSAFSIRLRFKDRKDILPKYFAYIFKSDLIRKTLSLQGNGTNISNLNQGILNNLKVPFPPLPTQQKIASILSAYDDLIENNLKRIELLEESAMLLYKEWFVDMRFPGYEEAEFVDGLPKGWERKEIKDFGEVITGKTPSTKRKEFEYSRKLSHKIGIFM